ILHGEIDPIQEAAVEVAARLAIQEVNATVLTAVATQATDRFPDAATYGDRFAELAARAASEPVGTRDAVRDELERLTPALDGSAVVLARLDGADPELVAGLEESRRRAADVAARAGTIDES